MIQKPHAHRPRQAQLTTNGLPTGNLRYVCVFAPHALRHLRQERLLKAWMPLSRRF
jgi:hypothetical protein